MRVSNTVKTGIKNFNKTKASNCLKDKCLLFICKIKGPNSKTMFSIRGRWVWEDNQNTAV